MRSITVLFIYLGLFGSIHSVINLSKIWTCDYFSVASGTAFNCGCSDQCSEMIYNSDRFFFCAELEIKVLMKPKYFYLKTVIYFKSIHCQSKNLNRLNNFG